MVATRKDRTITDAQTDRSWHLTPVQDVLQELDVNPETGLTESEVEQRREKYGPNRLEERQGRSPLFILWDQFTEVMVIVLIVAAAISIALGDWKDAIAILAIVVINAVLGFIQEYRAEQAMAALQELATPTVRVRRDGKVRDVDSWELVPGDIVLLEAGSKIPADGRLVEAANLRVQEASLTGESEPVSKGLRPLKGEDIPIADQRNMVFMGTAVTYGRGAAAISSTGMETQLGRIAELIQTVKSEQTPLQKKMGQLGKSLALAAVAIVAIVFLLGLLRNENPLDLFLTAVAMAVAAVPEGLPAVVTIALALGAQRMLRREALVRRLPAVETLGSVTVICSDKTGTLTQNRMRVTMLDVAGFRTEISQRKHEGMPYFRSSDEPATTERPSQSLLLIGGVLANDAIIEEQENGDEDFHTIGDPTEAALLVAAATYNLGKQELDKLFPRMAEIPFSSERKRMSTIHKLSQEAITKVDPKLAALYENTNYDYAAFTKGAVDGLLEISDRVWVEGEVLPLTDQWRDRIEEANAAKAQRGLRVLGVAMRMLDEVPDEDGLDEVEQNLIFVGLVGMIDPPRPEVAAAVATCKTAGIRPIMITGDHPLTAMAIAQELDIAESERMLTGRDLAQMSIADLEDIVGEVNVYARVSPEHKLNIVTALQRQGHIVAMTGDGVNDAPALRKSDIGVAMGITGTDVSKEAANMVILDDNFATIVRAVEEGRTIYDNVRRFIQYTMSSNAGEIYVMLFAPFLALGLPLTAIQILWINLVTDGLPGLALAVEPSESDTMERPPYDPGESVFARGLGWNVLWVGLLMGAISLGIGLWGKNMGLSENYWETLVFTTLTLSQMGNALAIRSNKDSFFKIGPLTNKPLLGAVALTFVLQMAVLYVPFMQDFFGTEPLSLTHLLIALVLSTAVFWAVELDKWVRRRRALPVFIGQ